MSNIGLHLRHNRYHIVFLAQEKPCSHSDLHLHEQQPINYKFLGIIHSSYKDSRLAFTTLQNAYL
jgi:hypothetical protein